MLHKNLTAPLHQRCLLSLRMDTLPSILQLACSLVGRITDSGQWAVTRGTHSFSAFTLKNLKDSTLLSGPDLPSDLFQMAQSARRRQNLYQPRSLRVTTRNATPAVWQTHSLRGTCIMLGYHNFIFVSASILG